MGVRVPNKNEPLWALSRRPRIEQGVLADFDYVDPSQPQ